MRTSTRGWGKGRALPLIAAAVLLGAANTRADLSPSALWIYFQNQTNNALANGMQQSADIQVGVYDEMKDWYGLETFYFARSFIQANLVDGDPSFSLGPLDSSMAVPPIGLLEDGRPFYRVDHGSPVSGSFLFTPPVKTDGDYASYRPYIVFETADSFTYNPATERYTLTRTQWGYEGESGSSSWNTRIRVEPIPEPASLAMVLVGAGGAAYFVRRRRHRREVTAG